METLGIEKGKTTLPRYRHLLGEKRPEEKRARVRENESESERRRRALGTRSLVRALAEFA